MLKRIGMGAGMIAVLAGWMLAQNISSTLSGTVKDPSGAVVPGATVTAVNNANGRTRQVSTGADGTYGFTLLRPGTYTVTVKKTGFQTYLSNDVVLSVGRTRTLLVQLQAGAVSQTVQVSAATVPVQLETAAQQSTVTGHQITQLQLNNRNFESLVTLQPGVSSSLSQTVGFGMNNNSSVAVNGLRPTMNNWTVDGADINDTGSNSTIVNVPTVDALQEFTIAGSGYSAKYGRSGGAQINVVTKSGTNQIHGDLYEFDRNTSLDANDYFSNAQGGTRGVEHYNDFGFTAGGPIWKNHIFLFASEEWRRESSPATASFTVPNPQIFTGDFTGLNYINASGQDVPIALNPASAPGCIAGDTISASCFSPNAQAYVKNIYSKYTPAPGSCTDGQGNPSMYCFPYTVNEPETNNTREDMYRLDWDFGNNIQFFARYMGDNIPTTEPGGLFDGANPPGVYDSATDAPGRNTVLHVTEELTPNLVNDTSFNYDWGGINSSITGIGGDASGFAGLDTSKFPFGAGPYNRIPGVGFPQISGVSVPTGPYHERNIDKQISDNLTYVRGNQTFSFGATAQNMTKAENASYPIVGSFSFGNEYGNPGFANFLLGDAGSYSAFAHDVIPDLRFTDVGIYAEDDWQVRPSLTLNLGIRYEYLPTPYDAEGTLVNFDPTTFSAAAVPLMTYAGFYAPGQALTPSNYVNGIIQGDVNSPFGSKVNPDSATDFSPRLGFSWDPFGHGTTAVRGGWGLYFDRTLDGIQEQNEFVDPPINESIALGATATQPLDLFDDPGLGANAAGLGPNGLDATGTPAFRVPRVQDWSVSIEHEFTNNTSVQLAYVGNHASYMLGLDNLNQLQLSTLSGLTGCVNGGTPGVGGAASTCPESVDLVPYVGWGTITSRAPGAISNYNSLQATVNHRTGNLTLSATYTYSSDLTDNDSDRSNWYMNPYDPMLDYGPATFNQPQVFVLSYVYELPNFGLTGWARNAFGGWEWSGVTSIDAGFPQTITQDQDPFNCDSFTSTGGQACPAGTYPGGLGVPSARPDVVAPTQGARTVAQWFNTGAFKIAEGHYGDASTGSVLGPGMDNWDMALMKNFSVGERAHVQLRGEFFNAFNHVNFTGVSTDIDSSNFGQLVSDFGPRQVQLGIKVIF